MHSDPDDEFLSVKMTENVVTFAVRGELTCPRTLQLLDYLIKAMDQRLLVLDLASVPHVSGATLAALGGLQSKALSAGKHLAVMNAQAEVHGTFAAAGLACLLDTRRRIGDAPAATAP
jgi:anti-anti-sigma factor